MTASIRLAVLLALGVALPAVAVTDPAKRKPAQAEAANVDAAQTDAAKATPEAAGNRFTFLDVNGDGVLSRYEYDSDVAFEMLDADHNASLSVAELQALLGSVQEGVPTIIPAESCYLGWQDSLTLLAKLVEAEIPE